MPGRNCYGQPESATVTLAGRSFTLPVAGDPGPRLCVFISYRHHQLDRSIAKAAATLLMQMGVDIFFDEHDTCLQSAADDATVALCIEAGLERSTALLGIVTPNTFSSPWIPYETGGARGRKSRFFGKDARAAAQEFFRTQQALKANPLWAIEAGQATIAIAHWIDARVTEVPGFVKLGVPLLDREGLKTWIALLLQVHGLQPERDLDDVVRTKRLETIARSLPERRTRLPEIVPWEELARGE